MIDLHFSIGNPWAKKWRNIRCWHGATPFTHKYWEVEVMQSADIIAITFSLTYRQDHAGIKIGAALLSYEIQATIYDSRHWDDKTASYIS
jgi:hypothetical protein